MDILLSADLTWLLATTLLTACLWIPYILQLIIQSGVVAAFWDPYHETPHEARWAQRAKRAHTNAVENLVVFAPLVLMVEVTGVNSSVTAMAGAIYFFARAAHFVAYTLAVPLVRTLLFVVGFGSQITLGLAILGYV